MAGIFSEQPSRGGLLWSPRLPQIMSPQLSIPDHKHIHLYSSHSMCLKDECFEKV